MLTLKQPSGKRAIRKDFPLFTTVISGGQTDSDQAGLRAAARLGLATGGYAPKGWKTLEGPAPWLGTDFGLVEHWSSDYAKRTAQNVSESDATIRIAADFSSPGERCTLKAITKYKKPYLDITVLDVGGVGDLRIVQMSDPQRKICAGFDKVVKEMLVRFLVEHSVKVLNVAGNSETTTRGIGKLAEEFLISALGMNQ